jgi:hypothetical protein
LALHDHAELFNGKNTKEVRGNCDSDLVTLHV